MVRGQLFVLKTERDALVEEVTTLRVRLALRNDQLKASQKTIRKSKKLLDLNEERCYHMGFDDAVKKSHTQGFDHKLLMSEGEVDHVGPDDGSDELPSVSFSEDEALSDGS